MMLHDHVPVACLRECLRELTKLGRHIQFLPTPSGPYLRIRMSLALDDKEWVLYQDFYESELQAKEPDVVICQKLINLSMALEAATHA